MIDKRVANIIVVIVTLAWSANFGAPFFLDTYKPDAAVHGVFMAIVGGTLALSRGSKGDDRDER